MLGSKSVLFFNSRGVHCQPVPSAYCSLAQQTHTQTRSCLQDVLQRRARSTRTLTGITVLLPNPSRKLEALSASESSSSATLSSSTSRTRRVVGHKPFTASCRASRQDENNKSPARNGRGLLRAFVLGVLIRPQRNLRP